jgi:uncharacterized 2Fe-2S/4Fe-4S cluster protein (DUF4445 family)
MPIVEFQPAGLRVEARPQATLLSLMRSLGIELESPCNGLGTCGKCKVIVHDRDAVVTAEDAPAGNEVLACTTSVSSTDVVVAVPAAVRGVDCVLISGQRANRPLCPVARGEYDRERECTRFFLGTELSAEEPGKLPALGVAVDIGTTTLVVSIIDLGSGTVLATQGSVNPQTRLGHDVLSRIRYASTPEGLSELSSMIRRELARLILAATGKARGDVRAIREIVLSGNTTMLHLVAGVSPKSLGCYPYSPAIRGDICYGAEELELPGGLGTRVYLPPVLDGFVGADITAGILAVELHRLSGVNLFIDIGTNGEMMLAVDHHLVGTSTAAGPAFEGMNITWGMRATVGAIEKVALDAAGAHCRTIGEAPAIGICGSGLIDAVSEMVRTGVINGTGRFANRSKLPAGLAAALVDYEGRPALRLAPALDGNPARDIVITQKDVRQVQLAKGAVRSGIDALLAREGLGAERVDRVLLAGSFGAHLDPASLAGIGLLPAELRSKVVAVGNTSRTGAEALLLDGAARVELARIVKSAKAIDLAHSPGFEQTFVHALAFPPLAGAAQ